MLGSRYIALTSRPSITDPSVGRVFVKKHAKIYEESALAVSVIRDSVNLNHVRVRNRPLSGRRGEGRGADKIVSSPACPNADQKGLVHKYSNLKE